MLISEMTDKKLYFSVVDYYKVLELISLNCLHTKEQFYHTDRSSYVNLGVIYLSVL